MKITVQIQGKPGQNFSVGDVVIEYDSRLDTIRELKDAIVEFCLPETKSD